jgi:hypothetical protein
VKLRIVNTDGRGINTKVFIDDQDVSECFRAVRVEAGISGAVTAELEAVACEVEFNDVAQLKLPNDTTRELLIKHGWTPPAEPVEVPVVVRRKTAGAMESTGPNSVYAWDAQKPLDPVVDLFTDYGEPIGGRELLNRFFERVQRDWEPNEHDELTARRVYDERGREIPGRREYTLTLTLDAPGSER